MRLIKTYFFVKYILVFKLYLYYKKYRGNLNVSNSFPILKKQWILRFIISMLRKLGWKYPALCEKGADHYIYEDCVKKTIVSMVMVQKGFNYYFYSN